VDAGDLIVTADTAETHARLEAAVGALLARGAVPVVIGGGHDLTFATVAALARHAGGRVPADDAERRRGGTSGCGGVSIDAHLDVRPVREGRITSGTPFRRALEALPSFTGERFVVLGPHGNRNARAHVEWLRARGGQILSLAEARQLGAAAAMETALDRAGGASRASTIRLFVSLDIDAAAQAFAPGCSAPSADGFAPGELLTFAFLAGRHPGVACFDVMEVNPRFDHDDRTAALAAAAIVHFLFGVAQRKQEARG
jgi:arginase family enzyme